jgi:autoinducer 2-degrading protein
MRNLHKRIFRRQPSNNAGLELRAGLAYFSFMFIVHVQVRVRPECVEAFNIATLANARASVQEPGVARFDVLQQADDPTRFVLVEVYRDAAASAAHKETKHYPIWRDAVASMMAGPRTSVKFSNVFPDDPNW